MIIATFFISNSPTNSINPRTNLVNNLPSYLSQTITRNFNRGDELDFIRNIADLEYKESIKNHRELIF
ncbi:Uncharacterised protein [Mycoplasmopsis arginini]|nr:Uncharacterised protein [Chlamydia trachomatis]SGA15567.1 Uncharacterised protein [Mycoplasmopsis arginini]SGA28745.1 Uncharacterised protein [Mycoplasmopsis arginini]